MVILSHCLCVVSSIQWQSRYVSIDYIVDENFNLVKVKSHEKLVTGRIFVLEQDVCIQH